MNKRIINITIDDENIFYNHCQTEVDGIPPQNLYLSSFSLFYSFIFTYFFLLLPLLICLLFLCMLYFLLSSPLLISPSILLSFYTHLYTLFSSFCRASQATGIPTKIVAVEKNLHAVITLRNRAVTEEWENVQIIEKGEFIPEYFCVYICFFYSLSCSMLSLLFFLYLLLYLSLSLSLSFSLTHTNSRFGGRTPIIII